MEMHYVYCKVGTELLCSIWDKFMLPRVTAYLMFYGFGAENNGLKKEIQ
jgi:hypothetical protein